MWVVKPYLLWFYFLCLSVVNPYILGLQNLTFGGCKSLPSVIVNPNVWVLYFLSFLRLGILNPHVRGMYWLNLEVVNPYFLGL